MAGCSRDRALLRGVWCPHQSLAAGGSPHQDHHRQQLLLLQEHSHHQRRCQGWWALACLVGWVCRLVALAWCASGRGLSWAVQELVEVVVCWAVQGLGVQACPLLLAFLMCPPCSRPHQQGQEVVRLVGA